ncbi:MAG: hypothetical protein WCX79_00455 [Candidatus Paceibacterota bacterium]
MTENTKNQYRCETCCNYASTDCPSETNKLLFDINHNNFLGFSIQRDKMYNITETIGCASHSSFIKNPTKHLSNLIKHFEAMDDHEDLYLCDIIALLKGEIET